MWKKRLAEETMANYFIENEILEPKKNDVQWWKIRKLKLFENSKFKKIIYKLEFKKLLKSKMKNK